MIGRQSGTGTAMSTAPDTGNPDIQGAPVAPKAGGLFDGMGPITIDADAANDPTQTADGTPLPLPRIPSRLRNWGPTNEPLRAERVEADYATPVTYTTSGGAIISTRDAVTFGFGLEQVDQATRNELVARSLRHLLPTTADTTPPTIVGFKYPANFSNATPRDPVEIELTTYDERGDMDYVELKVGDTLIQRTEVYPFQFRYTPPASAVGSTVKLTAEAVDAAGNRATRGPVRQRALDGGAGRVAGPGRPADAGRHPDRRLDAELCQRRVPERARAAGLRVAAQRRGDRRSHRGELHADRGRSRADDRLPHLGL